MNDGQRPAAVRISFDPYSISNRSLWEHGCELLDAVNATSGKCSSGCKARTRAKAAQAFVNHAEVDYVRSLCSATSVLTWADARGS